MKEDLFNNYMKKLYNEIVIPEKLENKLLEIIKQKEEESNLKSNSN